MRNEKEMNNEKLEIRNGKLERGKERWEMGRHKKKPTVWKDHRL